MVLSLKIDKRSEKINEAMSPGNGVDLFAIYEIKVISYKDQLSFIIQIYVTMEQAAFRIMRYLLLKKFRRMWIILDQEYNGERSDIGREVDLKHLKGLFFNSKNVNES